MRHSREPRAATVPQIIPPTISTITATIKAVIAGLMLTLFVYRVSPLAKRRPRTGAILRLC
jgi:hypothetical protein